MRYYFKISIFVMTIFLMLFDTNCEKSNEPKITRIRMAIEAEDLTGNLSKIYFLALARDDRFSDLDRDEVLNYNKNDAEWYIDGIFTNGKIDNIEYQITAYKNFNLPSTKYNYLLSATGVVIRSLEPKLAFNEGDNTIILTSMDIIQP